MKETLVRVSSGGKGGSVALRDVLARVSNGARWPAHRGSSTAVRSQGGRHRVVVACRGRGTAARGWRAEEAQETAALARARRDEGEQRYGLRLNSSPHVTEKELEKGVLKPHEIH